MIAYVIAVPAPICILLSTIYCVQCRKSYLEIRHSLSFRVFCIVFCGSLFVLFFLLVSVLSVFDLQLLVAHLVSTDYSFINM